MIKLESLIPEYYSLIEKQIDLTEAYYRPYNEYNPDVFQVDVDKIAATKVLSVENTGRTSLQNTAKLEALKATVTEELLAEKMEFDRFLDIYENKAKTNKSKPIWKITQPQTLKLWLICFPIRLPFLYLISKALLPLPHRNLIAMPELPTL